MKDGSNPEILTLQLQLVAQPISFQQKKYLSYSCSFGISKHCNLQNTIYISTEATIRSQDEDNFFWNCFALVSLFEPDPLVGLDLV